MEFHYFRHSRESGNLHRVTLTPCGNIYELFNNCELSYIESLSFPAHPFHESLNFQIRSVYLKKESDKQPLPCFFYDKMIFLRVIFIFFLIFVTGLSLVLAEDAPPSFSFSETKGLEPLSKTEELPQTENIRTEENLKAKENTEELPQTETTGPEESLETKDKADSQNDNQLTEKLEVRQESHSEKKEMEVRQESHSEKKEMEVRQESHSGKKEMEVRQESHSEKKEVENLETPENLISEDFAPENTEDIEEEGFLDSLFEDTSWFFQKKKTKHKLGLIPVPYYDRSYGLRLDLRFFTYAVDQKGYYFAFSGSQYLFRPFNRFNAIYIGDKNSPLKTESFLIYDNHYENNFGERGMTSEMSDLKKLYAHRLIAGYKVFYQEADQGFYFGLEPQLFFRKERPKYQNGKTFFGTELFVYLRSFAGYDSRDNWKDPKSGVLHQLSFSCKAVLDYEGAFCKGEGDFRFYVPLFKEMDWPLVFKDSVFAFRSFVGYSLLRPSPYSLAYSLGGQDSFQGIDSLRGFEQNRFRGDKMYFAQTEIRFPVFKEYVEAVLFTELGEVAEYKKSFQNFVVDYGGGIRIAFPPDYDMKLRIDYGTGLDIHKQRNYDLRVSFFQAF